MDIFSELKKLNFPQEKYLVIGGAALAARKLKQTRDLDILVEKIFLKNCVKTPSGNIILVSSQQKKLV